MGRAVEKVKFSISRRLVHVNDRDAVPKQRRDSWLGEAVAKVQFSSLSIFDKAGKVLQFRFRVMLASLKHVMVVRSLTLLGTAKDQDSALRVEERVYFFVPLPRIAIAPLRWYRLDFQHVRLQLLEATLLDQLGELVQNVIDGLHARGQWLGEGSGVCIPLLATARGLARRRRGRFRSRAGALLW